MFASEASSKNHHNNYLQQQASQSSFRDSAKQALAASKHHDGSLRIHTPFQEQQQQKVASLKEKMNLLNSSSVRCQSYLGNSSAASVTAATSYAGTNPGASSTFYNSRQGYGYRPNSNISNVLDSRNVLVGQKTYGTDLSKFSQNSVSKDLSPLRVSCLQNGNSGMQASAKNVRTNSNSALPDLKSQTAIQDSRSRANLVNREDGYSPMYAQDNTRTSKMGVVQNFDNQRRVRNSSSKDNHYNSHQRGSSGGGRNGSSLQREAVKSTQSLHTNQSSPERLVNIVCPASRSKQGKSTTLRSSSEMRRGHQIYNSFASKNESSKDRKSKIFKQMQALADSNKWSQSFSTTQITRNNNRLSTPHKSKSKKSLGSRCSLTKSKSKSCQRISRLKRTPSHDNCSTHGGLSTNNSKSRLCQKTKIEKWVKSSSSKRLDKSGRNQATHSSLRQRSESLSNNSNAKQKQKQKVRRSSGMTKNRDKERVEKYLKNQKVSANVLKNFNFTSIETNVPAENNAKQPPTHRMPSGQVTGKFRSLNEPVLSMMGTDSTSQAINNKASAKGFATAAQQDKGYSGVKYSAQNTNLQTEDDYCETLTASSEESPMRPSQRVQRAAKLTTKEYLNEVNFRVDNALKTSNSILEFGPRKMKAAYKEINERQGARLQCLKQQMQESLVETHQLQAKLQSSNPDGHDYRKSGGVSQFNSLVMGFSQNLEDMAQSMVEATETKRKNLRMKSMIAEMQEIRKQRSSSRSAPVSARKPAKPSLSNNSKRRSVSRPKSARSNQSSQRNSSRSSRSKSSQKSSRKSKKGKSLTRKRSQSGKKLTRKRSQSDKKLRKRSKSFKSVKSKSSRRKKQSARSTSKHSFKSFKSAPSQASSRGRSRSRKKKVKSIKRNIYKQTDGFRNVLETKPKSKKAAKRSMSKSKSKSCKSRKSRSKSTTTGQAKVLSMRKRSVSVKSNNRTNELARLNNKLVNHKYDAVRGIKSAVSTLRKRSMSKGKRGGKSRSKSKGKLSKTKKGGRSKSKTKSKSKARRDSKSPSVNITMGNLTPIVGGGGSAYQTPNMTPTMTPLHNILRNSIGDAEISDIMRTRANRFGSTAQKKKVKIQSQRLQDITHLTSSDSDSSYDSEDSLDNARYLKQQQAQLSPWQRACVRKQLPKKLR